MADPEPLASPAPSRIGAMLHGFGTRVLDVAFPPACLVCRRSVGQGAPGLCGACWRGLRLIERPYCDRLCIPFGQDFGPDLLSPEALARPPVYGRARAVVRFEDGPARTLVHALKYGDRLDLASTLGAWMVRAGADVLRDADLLVPVPLHRTRLWRRQFNQAAELARAVSRLSGVACDPLTLRRIKPTASQVGMTRAQRIENVQGAFAVDRARAERLVGRRVVLVDDVLTTGSTLNAAARALLRARAERVDVLVFARVVAEG